jgi:predicted lipoprotein
MRIKNIGLLIIAASISWSCDSGSRNIGVTDNFDVSTILTNVSGNIIIKRYQTLSEATSELKSSVVTFNATVSQSNLDDVQEKFRLAYLAWQECSAFKFGYAETNGLRGMFNTFPTDTVEIKTLLSASSPNYEQASYTDAIGFPGLDYILFSHNDADILDRFSTAVNKEGAKDYLMGIATLIDVKSNEAHLFWKNNSGGFKADFNTDKSKAVSSAFSNLVNEFVWDVEFMKNYQISYPAGKYTLNTPRPELTEAINSGFNIQLYKTHLLALKRLYIGENSTGDNGIGFDDYLIELKSDKNGKSLHTLIIDQFDLIEEKIDDISGDLIDAINNQPTLITELFIENKLLVSYFKVNMCSEFNVQITFTDNDGD